jgi:putative peptidoglycan lipid II flippase
LEDPALVLAGAVLVGGLLQAAVQAPAVRRLGFAITPMLAAIRTPGVGRVLRLMLPGIPVLGINQINQLVSNRFASFLESGVSYTYGAYRVTELVFGSIVVQLTTVLLPVLSRELRLAPERAPRTLLETATLVSFVTIPAAAVMAVLSRPIIGLLFGGGRFGPHDVEVTGLTLTAYAFSLVGTGQVKVMASAFFAHKNTRTPMWGSLVSLIIFTAACALMVGPWGTQGLGWANTVAMACYGLFLSLLYTRIYGFGEAPLAPALVAVARQAVASAAVALALFRAQPWLAGIDHTSLAGALRLGTVLAATAVVYAGLVSLLGGRELRTLVTAVRARSEG